MPHDLSAVARWRRWKKWTTPIAITISPLDIFLIAVIFAAIFFFLGWVTHSYESLPKDAQAAENPYFVVK